MRLSQGILLACIAAGIAVLCGLGTWQLQRLQWKEAMIERVVQGTTQPAVSISEIESQQAEGRDIEYRPAFAEGIFQHQGEQHLFTTHKGKVGYNIFTPLKLDDGRMLMVNRGFVPMVEKDQAGRQAGLVQGRVRVNGLARSAPAQKPNSFVPNNDLAKNIYYWKSISQMTGQAFDKMAVATVPLFLDADDAPVPGGLPIGGVTLMEFPNNHLQYAFTWFGLAGALLFVGGYFVYTRKRSSQA